MDVDVHQRLSTRRARRPACPRPSGRLRSAGPRNIRSPARAPGCRWSAGPAGTPGDRPASRAGPGRLCRRGRRPREGPDTVRVKTWLSLLLSERCALLRHCTAGLRAPVSIASWPYGQTPPRRPAGADDAGRRRSFSGASRSGDAVEPVATGSTWVLTSTGRFGDMVLNRFEMKYNADWQPIEMRLEVSRATKDGDKEDRCSRPRSASPGNQRDHAERRDQLEDRSDIGANGRRCRTTATPRTRRSQPDWPRHAGRQIPIYVRRRARSRSRSRRQRRDDPDAGGRRPMRKYQSSSTTSAHDLDRHDRDRGRLARLEIPAAILSVARSDLAGVGRAANARNPTDVDVTIPASGFNIAGTMTKPRPTAGSGIRPSSSSPASGPIDRDGRSPASRSSPARRCARGAGFLVAALRQARRRPERRPDRNRDAQGLRRRRRSAIVKWLARRDDVDPRRIAVAGHSEGGSVAMLAAAREKKIASLVLLSPPAARPARISCSSSSGASSTA